MKREFLKGLDLEDAVIDQIMDENGKDINKANDKIKTLETEVNNTKELLTNANKEIDSYKSMDIDAIKKSAEDYKAKYETAENDYKAQIAEMELNNKLEKYVDKLNLKNDIYKKEVISQIKEKELKFDGDTLLGGEELVKGFKEKYADAFIDDKPKPSFSDTTPGTPSNSNENSLRIAMGLKPKEI
jgi:hypothetical protein